MKGISMLTDSQHREVRGLIRTLSSDLSVLPALVVEAIQDNDDIYKLVHSWLMRNDVKYYDVLRSFSEVF